MEERNCEACPYYLDRIVCCKPVGDTCPFGMAAPYRLENGIFVYEEKDETAQKAFCPD